jgi:hypothetical protein
VAAAYANQLLATGDGSGRQLSKHARVYLSDDPADIYSQNLAADLETSFTERGFPIETVAFSPSGNGAGAGSADRHVSDPGEAGRDACFFDGIVLYAGRGVSDFQAFLDGVAHRCRERPPFILAGDDVTRYVADRNVSGANRSVPFQFLSFAMSPELGGQVPAEARDFYARLHTLFLYEQAPSSDGFR